MAYGNLPGGGYSGFLKAEKPLNIKKRSYDSVKNWPPKYGIYGEDVSETEALLPEIKAGRKKREKKKRKPVKKTEIKRDVDEESDKEIEREDAAVSLTERKQIKRDKTEVKKRKITKRKKTVSFADELLGLEEKSKSDVKTKELEKEDDVTVFVPEDTSPILQFPESQSEEEPELYVKFKRTKIKPTYTYYRRKRRWSGDMPSIILILHGGDGTPRFGSLTTYAGSQALNGAAQFNENQTPSHPRPLSQTSPDSQPPRIADLGILRFCPCLDRLLHSKRIQYRGMKAMLGFPIGALFGFVLYWMVLERIGAEPYYFWLLGIFAGVGFALSTQVRCICFLSIPACCGRAGRAFISTYVVFFVIEGPFTNILANGKEAMRSISCTASLNLNHSMERFQLMFKPVKEIVLDFVGAGDKVQKDTKELEKTFENIEGEVRDENEVKENMADIEQLDDEIGIDSRVSVIKKKFKRKRKAEFGENSEKKYGMKSELRCEEVFTKGVRACYDSFGKAYDRCHSYLPIIGYLLCWPMKLTFICDIAGSLMGKRSCDSDNVMNPGFGASVDTADGVQSEFEKDFEVQLQYKLVIPEESVNQLVPEDVAGVMRHSFERRKKNLEFFTLLVDRILALLVLLVLNASRKYCNQYLRIIQFDNKYVTSYFRHIDARRRKAGKMVLLPLKKVEKLELFDPFAVKFSADEKMLLIVNFIKLISEVLTVSILLLFDWIFYELLDIIKRHAHVTYQQTGVHHIKMTIYGDGFVGNMVRGILKGFDKKHTADQVTTTEECLPLPTKLPTEMIIRLYLVFLIMLILMISESYALRLRRVICSFFYPKREKRRILFLYNDRLKKRRSFLKHMRHRVRKQAREQAIAIDSGVLFSLRKFYPKYFGWITKLGLGLEKCLICSETESKTCRLISCSECPFSYCSECWQDTEGKCYACLPEYDTEPSEDSLSDD